MAGAEVVVGVSSVIVRPAACQDPMTPHGSMSSVLGPGGVDTPSVRDRAWGAGRHAAAGDWRIAILWSGESRRPSCHLLAVKTAMVEPM